MTYEELYEDLINEISAEEIGANIKNYIENNDKHWNEVLTLAAKYGFIMFAYDGVATLGTNKNQLEHLGEEKYKIKHNIDD